MGCNWCLDERKLEETEIAFLWSNSGSQISLPKYIFFLSNQIEIKETLNIYKINLNY